MRVRTVVPAMAVALSLGLTSAAVAGRDKDKSDVRIKTGKISKADTKTNDAGWHRGEWTQRTEQEQPLTWQRGEWVERMEKEPLTVRPDRQITPPFSRGPVAMNREFSGPYRYFFTNAEGKYDYYLDHYAYPYQYGATEMNLPVDTFGYVPPEQAGGGPVLYYRDERPLSWSIFDATRP